MRNNKLHIVLLADCLEDFAGGAEKQIFELAKGLDKEKYGISVVSLDCQGKASKETIESLGCKLFVFPVRRIYGLSGLTQGIRFKRFLKNQKADILMTYHFSSDIWGTFWGRLAGVKAIISNRRDIGFWRKKHHVIAYSRINRWVTKIIGNSNAVKNMVLTTERVTQEKVEIIYNGIELTGTSRQPMPVASIKRKIGVNEGDIVLMHVANLKPIKGHVFLLEAVAMAAKNFPNVKLVLIGKDELNGALQKKAHELNIEDKIVFLGKRQDVASLLSAADICVLPSLSEGMSNAILEYMAAGKPVIATNVGGNPELVKDGNTGLLVEKENTKELAGAIEALIRDSEKRKIMGQNGYDEIQKRFSMEKMVNGYQELFDRLADRRKKVLHLVSSGGLFGAEKVILNLASHSNGFISFVGALKNKHNPHLEIIDEANRLKLPTAVFDSNGKFDLTTVNRVKKFLEGNGIDIIHTHNYKSDLIGCLAARLAKKRWVATNHVWHGTDRKLQIYEKIDAFILRFACRAVAVADEIREELISKNLNRKKTITIHNGIDISQFKRLPVDENLKNEFGIKNGECVVTVAGRLSVEKGHKVFLSAAQEVLKSKKNVKFLIVGNGPLKENLQAETVQLQIADKVIFTGIRGDMPEIYSLSDILVNSSFIEGLPMTVLEAMASKLPVIATRVGALPQIILHDVTGVLLNPGDSAALSQAICNLLDNPEKRKMLAERAYRDVCENFSVTKMADQYVETYRQVLNEAS